MKKIVFLFFLMMIRTIYAQPARVVMDPDGIFADFVEMRQPSWHPVRDFVRAHTTISSVAVLAGSLGSLVLADSQAFSECAPAEFPYFPQALRLMLVYGMTQLCDRITVELAPIVSSYVSVYLSANGLLNGGLFIRNMIHGSYAQALINQMVPFCMRFQLLKLFQ